MSLNDVNVGETATPHLYFQPRQMTDIISAHVDRRSFSLLCDTDRGVSRLYHSLPWPTTDHPLCSKRGLPPLLSPQPASVSWMLPEHMSASSAASSTIDAAPPPSTSLNGGEGIPSTSYIPSQPAPRPRLFLTRLPHTAWMRQNPPPPASSTTVNTVSTPTTSITSTWLTH